MIVTLNIPDAVAQRVIDAFKIQFNYPVMKLPGETEGAFTKRMWIQFAKDVTAQVEAASAVKTAEAVARASVDTDIVIT